MRSRRSSFPTQLSAKTRMANALRTPISIRKALVREQPREGYDAWDRKRSGPEEGAHKITGTHRARTLASHENSTRDAALGAERGIIAPAARDWTVLLQEIAISTRCHPARPDVHGGQRIDFLVSSHLCPTQCCLDGAARRAISPGRGPLGLNLLAGTFDGTAEAPRKQGRLLRVRRNGWVCGRAAQNRPVSKRTRTGDRRFAEARARIVT